MPEPEPSVSSDLKIIFTEIRQLRDLVEKLMKSEKSSATAFYCPYCGRKLFGKE